MLNCLISEPCSVPGGVRRGLSISVEVDRLDEPIEVSSGVIYSAGVDWSVRNIFTAGISAPSYHVFIFEASISDFVLGWRPKSAGGWSHMICCPFSLYYNCFRDVV